jgi:N6-adenosine-specific RNA methylase IME4
MGEKFMLILIDEEFKNLCPPLSNEEREKLENNIIMDGCRDALVIWKEENILIDGHNRHGVCTKNEIQFKTTELSFKTRQEVKSWIISNQLGRRNLTPDKFTYMLGELYLVRKKDKENNLLRGDSPNPQNEVSGNTAQQIADEYKLGRATVERAAEYSKAIDTIAKNLGEEAKEKILNRDIQATRTEIIELAKEKNVKKQEEILDSLEKADGKTDRVSRKSMELDVEIKREEIMRELKPIPIPIGEYDVIYADPPWRYDFAETENRAIENKYPSMDIEDIKAVKVPTSDNAVLFLWATSPKLIEALEVMKVWGFTYKTHSIWDKEVIGMGYWFRGQHELLLVGTKGNYSPPKQEHRESSVYREKRTEHSKKPSHYYDFIEKSFPNGKYLEMFSRLKYNEKWEVWGNQCE